MGDQPGEEQPPLPEHLAVPPAPALSAASERATFEVAPGFRVELVAAEPLVRDPVRIAWDERGRLWVVEMRGYMPNVDGAGEEEPNGTIAVLEDADGDGRMDRRTEFLSGLVLPRGVAPCRGGALVLAPPHLLFCRDTDGDGRADEREVVDTNLGGIQSPEHALNGLLWSLDGAFHNARAGWSYRFSGGRWMRERTAGGGQWGIGQDDTGRIFFNTNSVPLFVDLFASHYAIRNPNHGHAAGVAVNLMRDRSLRPARMNTGINRGYQEHMLDAAWRLREFTAACSPWVMRGDAFPGSHRGDAFVCEPAANLVKRYELSDDGLFVVAEPSPAPTGGSGEFLTSTDERFRPVDLRDGPDGNLYVADLYRGVIQHRIFVTSWLRRQVADRGLETPTGLGRIWRIVHDGTPGRGGPDLADASWTELVETLSHPSGWWRDQAQRLIVEEGEGSSDARELLAQAALHAGEPLGRMHALWALHALDATERAVVLAGLADGDARVRLAAVRVAEPWLAANDPELVERVFALAAEAGADARVRQQVVLSLGLTRSRRGDALLAALLAQDASTPEARSAVISGLHERELGFLERLLADGAWTEPREGRDVALRLLARCVVREGRSDRIERLLERIAGRSPAWQREALIAGVLAGRPIGPDGNPTYVRVNREPARIDELEAHLAWPGKPGVEEIVVRPLDDGERARFERGRAIYGEVCTQCHLSGGSGGPGLAPPLRDSEWVLGPVERPARIVLHGLTGPVTVRDTEWDLDMPAYVASDEDVAAILTYVRREWGHGGEPVTPAEVRAVREAERGRGGPWTAAELRARVE